ncbi:hypothetical protein C8R41DRAFT_815177 [Lentinula lateritia]|uniref:Uncharacterized protein n=1 Tax=Lentinula lateritia TaxID=40482 RepID=A0ABQ8VSH0_9AGAR|nr:hypothetical protein C8R41DRAFT_815177 [Lentinula lateritia]
MSSGDPNRNRSLAEPAEDTESSIQNTIQRLDLAFERIRHLRRDILYPEQVDHANSSHSRNRIGPGHEAIVLTGQNERANWDELERMDRMRNIVPADTRERLRQFETRRAEADRERNRDRNTDRDWAGVRSHLLRAAAAHMHPLDTSTSPPSSHPSSAQSPLSFASPLSPPRQRLLPHRLLDAQPFRRRESSSLLSDDPNTEIGRRVAARESARGATQDSTHNPSPNSNSSSRDSHYRLPTVLERDFEYGTRTRLQRSEPAFLRRIDPSLDQLRREAESRISRSLDTTGTPPSPSAEASILRANMRTRVPQSRQSSNVSTNLPSSTSSQSRLSLLSNFGVQSLPTPSSTLSNPPLLFEEPASYFHPSTEDSRLRSVEEERARTLEESYMSQTRMAGGLLFSSSPVQMHHIPEETRPGHHRDNTVQLQHYAAPRLTQLDANGDEFRLDPTRVRQFAESTLGLYPPRRHAADEYPPLQPVTRSPIPLDPNNPDSDVISPENYDPEAEVYYPLIPDGPSSMRYVVSVESKPRYFGTSTPRYIDPLPSALVDKFTQGQSRHEPRRSYVHVPAAMSVMAGR